MLDPPPVGGRGIETKQGRTNGPNAADDPEKEDVMTNDSEPANLTLGRALHLARAGFVVFPCRQGDKRPATNNGLLDATSDEAMIRRWFSNDRGFNLAVACGPQPNGINLLAVDVDPLKGGDDTWSGLLNGHTVPPGPVHTTRSGGQHLFFDAPSDLHNTSGRLGPGIDTRGVGGYVVVPPSRVIDTETGEVGHYTATRETMLGYADVPSLPHWLGEMLDDDAGYSRHPSQSDVVYQGRSGETPILDFGDSVADKARVGWRWEVELDRDGWVRVRSRGDDEYWTRPGKNPREGHSAVLHGDDGPLVVFSTERPPGGRQTSHGEGASFSPWDYIVAYRAGGDTRRAAALVRGQPVPMATREAGGGPVAVEDHDTPLFPPPEFYEQRPWLAACRQMAQASGISPAALVVAYLTRWATFIPPGYAIPAINGDVSSFNLIGVVAAMSGIGKSSAMGKAARMLPSDRKDLRLGIGLGSGEGIIELFYDMVPAIGVSGQPMKSKERVRAIKGVHMAIDEGMLVADLNDRAGTTHISRLNTAWSDGVMSTGNASADKFRHIDRGQYRFTAMMGIQADRAHELMTDSLASQGFVGRLLFAWAEEPPVRPRPVEPPLPTAAEVAARVPPTTPTVLTYPQAVWNELIDLHDARFGRPGLVVDNHLGLLRLKVAGTFALIDDRTDVSMEDWALATTLVGCSTNVRNYLYAQRRVTADQDHQSKVLRRAQDEVLIDDFKERQKIASMAERARDWTKAQVRQGKRVTRRKLERQVSSDDTRHRCGPAFALAETNGWLRFDGDEVTPLA